MTERKITLALRKIKLCKEHGFYFEALIRSYHLNLELIRFILSFSEKAGNPADMKIKKVIQQLLKELSLNPRLKSIINKKHFKAVKLWTLKMEQFFRDMKQGTHRNPKELLVETERIAGLLNISVAKLLIKSK